MFAYASNTSYNVWNIYILKGYLNAAKKNFILDIGSTKVTTTNCKRVLAETGDYLAKYSTAGDDNASWEFLREEQCN